MKHDRLLFVPKNIVFWGVTPYSPVEVHRRFGRTYSLDRRDQRVNQTTKQQEMSYCFIHDVFFFGLMCNLEDGGCIFLQNVGEVLPDSTVSHRRRYYSSVSVLLPQFQHYCLHYL
jgi:hypothetical protein